jgi:DNA-binding transcriptional regulator YiaG
MRPIELRMARLRFGLSQAELASLLRVSRKTVERWEVGAHGISSIAEIALHAVFSQLQQGTFPPETHYTWRDRLALWIARR